MLSGEELETAREFGRYNDVDGDGIPYRTLPGTHPTRGAYFTRGTSRDRFARYTEEAAPYVDNMERLLRKFETARGLLPRPVLKPAASRRGSASSTTDRPRRRWTRLKPSRRATACMSTRCASARFRSRSKSPNSSASTMQVFVVEQNRDAQMRTLMTTDLELAPAQLISILHFGGMPITARFIVREIASRLRRPASAQTLERVS